jgi:phosphohistidine phosphatase
MGKFLSKQGVELDAILCSTAERATSTLKCFLEEFTFEGEVFYIDDLYGADVEAYIATLNWLSNDVDTAMIVGHNPTMDHFLEMICDEYEHMSTASIALIRFPIKNWTELNTITSGELLNLWKPREI